MATSIATVKPRIYVVCAASWEDGRNLGQWFDADVSAEELYAKVQRFIEFSPHPYSGKWEIRDCQGFGTPKLGIGEKLEVVAEIGQLISKYGDAFLAFALYHEWIFPGFDNAEYSFLRRYYGSYDGSKEFIKEFSKYLEPIPQYLEDHINWDTLFEELCEEHYLFWCPGKDRIFVFNQYRIGNYA